MRAEDGAEYPRLQAGSATAAEQIAQLRRALEEQADELASAESRLREITAICDFADWASSTDGSSSPTVVLVEDLRRILATCLDTTSGS